MKWNGFTFCSPFLSSSVIILFIFISSSSKISIHYYFLHYVISLDHKQTFLALLNIFPMDLYDNIIIIYLE